MPANTNFTAGQILTAAQANNFPRGLMARVSGTSAVNFSGETLGLTSPSFTAVVDRLYRITYFEPAITSVGNVELRLRLTNTTGSLLALSSVNSVAGNDGQAMCTVVTTLTAGSTVIVGTGQSSTNNGDMFRNASYLAQLIVEDIGLA
jgi:hypothetical protein